jgi:hypothetical protein
MTVRIREPLITDEQAVQLILDELQRLEEREAAATPRLTDAEYAASEERHAIAQAKGGRYGYLADLVEEGRQLSPEGRALVAAILRRKFKVGRGKYQREPSFNELIITWLVPFVIEVMRQHRPTMKVTKIEVRRWAALSMGRRVANVNNFARSRWRPSKRKRR